MKALTQDYSDVIKFLKKDRQQLKKSIFALTGVLMDRGGITFNDLKDTQKGRWAITFLKNLENEKA